LKIKESGFTTSSKKYDNQSVSKSSRWSIIF
jgi:hypothetical protein